MDKFVNARTEAIDCILSLTRAIDKSGGSVDNLRFTVHRMTLMEFMTTIAAQNGIRFCHVSDLPKPPKPDKLDLSFIEGDSWAYNDTDTSKTEIIG